MPKARHRPRGPGPGSAPHAPRRGPRAPGPAREPREAGHRERREGRGAPLGGGGGSAARAGRGGQPSRPPLVTPGSGHEDGGGGGKGGRAGKLPPRAHPPPRLELGERGRRLARAVLVRLPILRKQAGELQSRRESGNSSKYSSNLLSISCFSISSVHITYSPQNGQLKQNYVRRQMDHLNPICPVFGNLEHHEN